MKDGHTRREHYKAAGIIPDIEAPLALSHVWVWFCELSNVRSSATSANPISWESMAAYFALIGESPSKFEIDAIRAIDTIALSKTITAKAK